MSRRRTVSVYVARIKGCGCVVADALAGGRADLTAKWIAKQTGEGFDVERLPAEQASELPWGRPCEHMKAAE